MGWRQSRDELARYGISMQRTQLSLKKKVLLGRASALGFSPEVNRNTSPRQCVVHILLAMANSGSSYYHEGLVGALFK